MKSFLIFAIVFGKTEKFLSFSIPTGCSNYLSVAFEK